MSLTEGEEAVPEVGSNDAAVVRSKKARLEVKRGKKVTIWVQERDGGKISDKLGAVGRGRRWKQLDVAKLHDAIGRADREAVPLGPPTARGMSQ